jgi:hypothetical protein
MDMTYLSLFLFGTQCAPASVDWDRNIIQIKPDFNGLICKIEDAGNIVLRNVSIRLPEYVVPQHELIWQFKKNLHEQGDITFIE